MACQLVNLDAEGDVFGTRRLIEEPVQSIVRSHRPARIHSHILIEYIGQITAQIRMKGRRFGRCPPRSALAQGLGSRARTLKEPGSAAPLDARCKRARVSAAGACRFD